MTAAYMSLHGLSQVRVHSFYPSNSAALTIKTKGSGGDAELTLYGLPEDRAIQIVVALGDENTIVYHDGGGHIKLREYLETKDVFEALEGRKKENDHE